MTVLSTYLVDSKPDSKIIDNVDKYDKKGRFRKWWTRNFSNPDILKQIEAVIKYDKLDDSIKLFESTTKKNLDKAVLGIKNETCNNPDWINDKKQQIAKSTDDWPTAIKKLDKFYGLAELNAFHQMQAEYSYTPFAKVDSVVNMNVKSLEFLPKDIKALLKKELIDEYKKPIVQARDTLKKEFLESDDDLRNFREAYKKSQEARQKKADKVNTKEPYQQHADVLGINLPLKEKEMMSIYRILAKYNHPDKLKGFDSEGTLFKKLANAKDYFLKNLSFLNKNYQCEPDQLINRSAPKQAESPKNTTTLFKESVQQVRENDKEIAQTENTEPPLRLTL